MPAWSGRLPRDSRQFQPRIDTDETRIRRLLCFSYPCFIRVESVAKLHLILRPQDCVKSLAKRGGVRYNYSLPAQGDLPAMSTSQENPACPMANSACGTRFSSSSASSSAPASSRTAAGDLREHRRPVGSSRPLARRRRPVAHRRPVLRGTGDDLPQGGRRLRLPDPGLRPACSASCSAGRSSSSSSPAAPGRWRSSSAITRPAFSTCADAR